MNENLIAAIPPRSKTGLLFFALLLTMFLQAQLDDFHCDLTSDGKEANFTVVLALMAVAFTFSSVFQISRISPCSWEMRISPPVLIAFAATWSSLGVLLDFFDCWFGVRHWEMVGVDFGRHCSWAWVMVVEAMFFPTMKAFGCWAHKGTICFLGVVVGGIQLVT